MKLDNLDATTRKHMLAEFESDSKNNAVFISARLTEYGKEQYPSLLKSALEKGDILSFADALKNLFNKTELRKNKPVKVPSNVNFVLSEGEFNRYYIRGLCVRAIEQKIGELEIYRAKAVLEERAASHQRIGKMVDPKKLLDDLRRNIGIETALGIPGGPNSGISVRIPEQKTTTQK